MKIIFFILLSLLIFSGCGDTVDDAEVASDDQGVIYSYNSVVDPDLPALITSAYGTNLTFKVDNNIQIIDSGDLDPNYFTFEDGNFTWTPQSTDVGEHYLVLSDGNNTQDLTLVIVTDLVAPTGLTASQGSSSSYIELDYDDDYYQYNIYYSAEEDSEYTLLATTYSSNYRHYLTDSDKLLSLTYYYRVQGIDYYGAYSEKTDAVSGYVVPATPSSVTVSLGSSVNELEVTWNSSNENMLYYIYRSTDCSSSGYDKINETAVSGNSYLDDSVSIGDTYCYKVSALYNGYETSKSNASSSIEVTPPAVTNIEIAGTISSIDLTWDAIEGISSYNIYRSDTYYGTYSLLTTVSTSSYSDSVDYLDTKYYKVFAEHNDVESISFTYDGYSYIYVTAEVAPPSDINVSQGEYTDRVVISWSGNPNAETYTLYRATSESGYYTSILSDTNLTTYEDTSIDIDAPYFYKLISTYKGDDGYYSDVYLGFYGSIGVKEVFFADLNTPYLMVMDSKDSIYIIDDSDNAIYKITQDGVKTTFASNINNVYGLGIDSSDNIYISDTNNNTVYKITQSGVKEVVYSDLLYPYGIAFDSNDNMYIADYGNSAVVKITQDGDVDTFSSSVSYPEGITIDSNDNIYVLDTYYDYVYKITQDGSINQFDSGITTPEQLTVDSNDNIYVTDESSNVVYKITQDETQTTLASDFYYMEGIATDSSDSVYVSDSYYDTIIKVTTLRSKVPYGLALSSGILNWQPARDALSYNIYKSSSSDGVYELLENSTTTSYTPIDSDAFFKVKGVKADDSETEFSNVTYPIPVSPTAVTLTSNVNSVTLNWEAGNTSTYNVYRSSRYYGTYELLGAVDGTSYTDSNIAYRTTYYYKVTALFGSEESDLASTSYFSEYVTVAPPTNVTATSGIYIDKISISWDENNESESYTVYRSTSEDGYYSSIASDITAFSYDDSSGSAGVVYYYKVKSKNGYYLGDDYSDVASGYYGNLPVLIDTFSGDWTSDALTYNSSPSSYKSADITNNEETCTETTIIGAGELSFYWKVSSESGWDYLNFYVDGTVQTGSISGSITWTQKTYTQTGSGDHTYKWCYSKDSAVSSLDDAGWIDDVYFQQ